MAPHLLVSAHLAKSKGLLSSGLKKKNPWVPIGEAKGLSEEPMSWEEEDREGKGV